MFQTIKIGDGIMFVFYPGLPITNPTAFDFVASVWGGAWELSYTS